MQQGISADSAVTKYKVSKIKDAQRLQDRWYVLKLWRSPASNCTSADNNSVAKCWEGAYFTEIVKLKNLFEAQVKNISFHSRRRLCFFKSGSQTCSRVNHCFAKTSTHSPALHAILTTYTRCDQQQAAKRQQACDFQDAFHKECGAFANDRVRLKLTRIQIHCGRS